MKYIYENLNDDNIHRKERILRGCVFAAIIGFIIVGGVLGSAAAQETPDEKNKASLVLTLEEALTDNDWRPLSKIDANTDGILDQPLQANCPQNLGSCPENHGVYDRDPYFRIARDANGSLRLISDGDLMADVQVGSDGSIRIQFSDGNSATIEMNSDECISAEEDLCLEVTGVPYGKDLVNGLYVWRLRERDKNIRPEMTTGNIFVDKPPVLRTALGCFDITKMKTLLDMETKEISESGNILDRGRCSKNIFADADRNSQEYTVETFDDGKNYAMPYGFIYVSVPEGNASQKTKIIESENELKSSNTESFGWNTGLNLIVANFSVRHNKTTQNLVDELYKEKLIYARHDYVQTRNALVLDKWNVRLNKDFKSEINRLRTNPDKKHFDDFFKNWGTHYTYATTVGEQGSRVSQISEQNAIKLKESGVNVSTGAAVGVSIPLEEFGIPGSASSNLGLDGGNARSNYKKMSDILGSEVGEAKCLGGSTCTGNHASGSGPFVPIFLDLRPISDLLGPPFFSDIAVNELVALRSKLAQAITDYAWRNEPPRKEPAARFLRISGLRKVACFKKNNPNDPNPDPNRRYRKPDKIPSESCEIKNIQFKAGGQMTAAKEFNEKSAWVLPHPGNMQTKLANNSIVAALSVVADGSIQTAPFSRAETLMDMTYFGRPGSTQACFSVSVGASNIAPFGATIMLRGHVEEVSGEAFLDPSAALPDPQAVNPMCVDPSA